MLQPNVLHQMREPGGLGLPKQLCLVGRPGGRGAGEGGETYKAAGQRRRDRCQSAEWRHRHWTVSQMLEEIITTVSEGQQPGKDGDTACLSVLIRDFWTGSHNRGLLDAVLV